MFILIKCCVSQGWILPSGGLRTQFADKIDNQLHQVAAFSCSFPALTCTLWPLPVLSLEKKKQRSDDLQVFGFFIQFGASLVNKPDGLCTFLWPKGVLCFNPVTQNTKYVPAFSSETHRERRNESERNNHRKVFELCSRMKGKGSSKPEGDSLCPTISLALSY